MRAMIKNSFSLAVMLFISAVTYGQITISNPETLANVTTVDAQQNPAISMDTLGRYVVVWESEGQDGDGFGIYAKVYAADHTVIKDEFLINTTTQTGDQRFPDVAMNANGTWCVVWQSNESESTNGWDVYRRLYDASGTAITSRSRVNASVADNQMRPAVAGGDNYFVCAYMSEVTGSVESKIEARFLNDAGAYLSANFDVAVSTGNHLAHPDVALDNSGNAVFVWQADLLDGDRQGVYTAGYAQPSTLSFGPTQVNTETGGNQQEPSVASDGAGNAVIVWSSFDQDGDHYGVYAQQLNSAGSLVGSEFSVANSTAGSQDHASVAGSREGGKFIFTWTDEVADGDMQGVYARLFESGSLSGTEQLINTTTASRQMLSDVAIGQDTTEAVFAWQGGLRKATSAGTDPNDYGVYTTSASLLDETPPTAVCQNITVFLDGAGLATITAGDVDGGSTDNVGIVSSVLSLNSFTCADIGANSVTLTVTDAVGLSDNCTATVTVADSTSPTAVCQNITVYLDGAGNATITAADIDGGSTDNCGTPTLSASQTAFTCADVGANIVTLTATDGSGNIGQCTATVTVSDSVSPTAVCQNITVYLDGAGNATITAADLDGGSSDNCGTPTLSASQTSFTCANTGANNVTLTVTDGSGNIDQCIATVTVADSTSPVAVCQNVTVFLDGSGNASITSGDIDGGSSDNCGIASLVVSPATFTCANVGANNVTLTVTDGSGNIDQCTATVTVADSTSPTAVCQNITVYLDGAGNATITAADIDGGSADNCGTPTLSASQTAFTCADVGANNVTLTATDVSGNISQCTATVTLADSTSPTAVCQNITVYLDGAGNATITAADLDGGSSDNCGTPTLSASQTSFTCANTGANNVTLTVTDGSGNIDQCIATVTVADSTSPVAVCQNVTVFLDGSGNASITSGDIDGGSSDNCGIASLVVSPATFTCADVGANSVTLTVTDGSGNIDQCTATVTIADSTSPTAVCQNITVYLDGAGNATITAADIDGGSTDNCGTPTLSASQTAFTCADVGANNVTLTATDVSGNISQCTATVTVADSTSPTAFCQNITVYLDGAGNATITAADLDGGSSDNCGAPTLSASQTSFTCANTGANNVTLTVTDGSGNIDQCIATVTVSDSVSPTAVCQNITVYLDGAGNATITAADLDGGSTDNCGTPTLSASQTAFTCADVGANNVTLTATDVSGNISQCTATVTVADSTAPTAVCQNITVYLDGAGNATITAADIDGGSTDNCGTPTLSASQTAFTCAEVGANNVTLTATDVSGNISQCTATVTVSDSVSPTAVCQNITVYLDGAGNATITAADLDGGSSDNCGTPTLSASQTSFTCANVGVNTVTLTATDASGNVGTCSANVTVSDTISPVAITLADLTDECSVTATAPTTTDNCAGIVTGTTTDPLIYSTQGSYVITWTFDDGNGNTITATQNVIVDDVTPPVSPSLADVTGDCSASAVAPTTTDICAGTITGTTTDPLTYTSQGTYVITWTFDDGNGNTSTAFQNVIVDDATAPVTPVLAGITGECSATATAPTTTDNCAGIVTGTTTDPVIYSAEGSYVITWTFDDGNGNVTTATQNVIVDDVTPPVAPTLADLTDECSVTAIAPTTTDNCAGTVTGSTTDPLIYTTQGSFVITWTFDDGNGNTSTATQNVIVADVTPPTASNLDTAFVECLADAAIDVTLVDDEADNCVTPTVTYVGDIASNGTGCGDTITRTYNVADDAGNNIDVTQIIIVNDVTPPTASTPLTLNVVCLADVPSTAGATAWVVDEADNCGTPTVAWVSDVSSNGTGCNDTITRTFSVTDNCGNSISLQQLIIIDDHVAPEPDAATLSSIKETCEATPTTPTATDNCAGVISGVPDVTFPITAVGTTIVTWTFTDNCGNATTQTQEVTITGVDVSTTMASDGITMIALNQDAGVTYQWIDCETGLAVAGATNYNFTPTYGSDFAVIVTENGCSDTSACVNSTVGLDQIALDGFILYPNPTTGQFTVSFDGNIQSIEMVDVTGRIVMMETEFNEGMIDASLLAPGKYMVRLTSESGNILTQPIVIGQQ